MTVFFSELNIESVRDCVVLLDIDGTVVCDHGNIPEQAVLNKVKSLAVLNDVYFLSNTREGSRNEELAARAGIRVIKTFYKKPNARILADIPNPYRRPIVVIGDKWLTDGCFAWRIGARFIKVKRICGQNDRLSVKLVNGIDNIISWFLPKND